MTKYGKRSSQKEMTCPKCSEFSVFHKEVDYNDTDLNKYPDGRPIWQCGLCDHIVNRITRKT
jgi:hypothetical protein